MPKKGKRAAQRARGKAAAEEDGAAPKAKPAPSKRKAEVEEENDAELSSDEEQVKKKKNPKPTQNGDEKGGKGKGKGKARKGDEEEEEEDADDAPRKKKGPKPAQFTDLMQEATSAGSGEQWTVKTPEFSLGFQGKSLLENTQLTLAYGRRYGLVGINGSGKSTLLTALAKGEIAGIPKHIQVLHVAQEVEGDDTPAIETVIAADTERLDLLKEQQELEKMQNDDPDNFDEKQQERLVEVYKRLSAIGAHTARSRANAILTGLQFTERMKNGPTKELSGGWRMRISLARALFCRPHLLLLDEPTNHLDLYACIWFEAFLAKWKKTLLVVSHDIDLLNNVCTDIIHLDHTMKKLDQYKGNYDHFVQRREEKLQKHVKDYEKQQKEIARLRKQAQTQAAVANKGKAGVKKERSGGGTGREKKNAAAKKAKQKGEELKDMVLIPKPEKAYKVSFSFPEPERLPHPVLQVKDVSFAYPPKQGADPSRAPLIFDDINLGIDLDSRVALVGPNGAGKSTLLGLLNGKLTPTKGEVIISRKLRIAKFDQHTTEQLDLSQTPVEFMMATSPGMSEQDARKHLGRYGLSGKTQMNRLDTLSGGQKSRAVLASLALRTPHLLFLDEPTNHLDIESIRALCEALAEFKGGVVLVTHDQNLIARGCNRIWCIDGDQKVKEFDGDFYEYQKRRIAQLDFSELEELF